MFLLRTHAGIVASRSGGQRGAASALTVAASRLAPVGAGTSVTPGQHVCSDAWHHWNGTACVPNTGPLDSLGYPTLGPNDVVVTPNPGVFAGDPCTMKNGCAGGLSQDLVTCIQIDPKCGVKPPVSSGSGLLIGAGVGIAAIALFTLALSGHAAAPKRARHV